MAGCANGSADARQNRARLSDQLAGNGGLNAVFLWIVIAMVHHDRIDQACNWMSGNRQALRVN